MAAGTSVRLTKGLTERARSEARLQDRSLTEQVEHWSRLGQIVEEAIAATTVARLKARSHAADLVKRLGFPDTPKGRAHALALITNHDPVRYGTEAKGSAAKATKIAPKKRPR